MHALIYDNLTEHTVTMNVLERMNIYQEVILGILYRSIPFIKVSHKEINFLNYENVLMMKSKIIQTVETIPSQNIVSQGNRLSYKLYYPMPIVPGNHLIKHPARDSCL